MSVTSEFKQYGGIVTEQGKLAFAGVRTSVLAAVGAGDLLAAQGKQLSAAASNLATRAGERASVRLSPAGVRDYLQSAGESAVTAYGELSQRGAEVVHELRKDPRVQRVILRAERTVDVVEDGLEELVEEAGTDAERATDKAKTAVAEGAERTRATVRKTAARNTNARKSTTKTAPARKAPPRKASARKAGATS